MVAPPHSPRACVCALHRQDVAVRRRDLDAEGVAHAIRVYEDGWSVARTGDRLASTAPPPEQLPKPQGSTLRDTHGRQVTWRTSSITRDDAAPPAVSGGA